jgi:hypothetical protein
MSFRTAITRPIVGAVLAATVASATLVGLATTAHAQTAVSAAPMAKCIPGTGNPLNPCPWP